MLREEGMRMRHLKYEWEKFLSFVIFGFMCSIFVI